MQLNLKTKSVRFELVDEESETTISLSSEDDQETICRKLRKVLSLVDPEMEEPAPMVPAHDLPVELAKQQFRRDVETVKGAWHKAPEPPEHWQGEVEVIPQEGS